MNTRVELSEADALRLKRLADARDQAPADVVGDALRALENEKPGRVFHLVGSGRGDGTSFADLDEDEQLEGFGE